MSMDRLRQAIEFTDREDDGWVYWSYQPGHEAAIYDAAKSVLDAPRIWWCIVADGRPVPAGGV